MTNLIKLGTLIDQSIDFYKDHFKRLMKPALVAFIIPVLQTTLTLLNPLFPLESNLAFGINIGLNVFVGLLTILVLWWVSAELITIIHLTSEKKSLKEKTFAQNSVSDFFRYILVTLALGIIVALLTAGLISPGLGLILYAFPKENGAMLSMVGTIGLLLGAFINLVLLILISVRFGFIAFATMIEKTSVIQSFKRSWNLVQNRFFRTLWLMAVPKILLAVIQIILSSVVLLIPILLATTLNNPTTSIISEFIGNTVTMGITILFLPLVFIADYFIFQSLKETSKIE